MLVFLDIILLAAVASCSDTTIRPVALCNFDQHTCGWTNDPSSSLHPWKIQHRPPRGFPTDPPVTYPVLCFSANAEAEEDKDTASFSFWLTVPSKPLVKKSLSGELRARLWSPTVPAALGLRCLKFSYTYVDQPKASRLQLDKRAKAVCRFDKNTCGWTNDNNNDWQYRWILHRQPLTQLTAGSTDAVDYPILCFSASALATRPEDSGADSWLAIPSQQLAKSPVLRVANEMQARIWSPPVPASLVQLPHPKAVCGFEKSTCGWKNDANNWQRHWRIHRELNGLENVGHLPILCLTGSQLDQIAKQEDEDADAESSWASDPDAESPSDHVSGDGAVDIQARLWSPTVRSTLGLRCLTLAYSVRLSSVVPGSNARDRLPSLALLQRQEGPQVPGSEGVSDLSKPHSIYLSTYLPQGISRMRVKAVVGTNNSERTSRSLAVCGFEEHNCGWTNDANNWEHRWEIRKRPFSTAVSDDVNTFPAICLLAKSGAPVENRDALSWLPSLSIRKQSKPISQGLQARLWSPPLPAELGLRCLKFVYIIHWGAGLTGPAPLAVCRFDNADTCGWINDFNNWRQRWNIVKTAAWTPRVWTHTLPALCLTTAIEVPNRIQHQEGSSSWIPVTGKKKPKTSALPLGGTIQARFWSPSIPTELGLKCLQLAYHIHLGQPSPAGSTVTEDKSLTLTLLQRQEGCKLFSLLRPLPPRLRKVTAPLFGLLNTEPAPAQSSHTPIPLYVWTFNEMDLGDWTNDANNWRQKWTVLAAPTISGTSPALCLRARAAPAQQPTKSQVPWLANRRRIQEPDPSSPASARLWSPSIPADVGMRCLTFHYSLHLGAEATAPVDINLALLQRPRRPIAKLSCSFSSSSPTPCLWLPDHNDWGTAQWKRDVLLPANSGQTAPRAAICLRAVDDQSETTSRLWSPAIQSSQPNYPLPACAAVKPFHAWTFDEDMGDWTNDGNNWRQRWTRLNLTSHRGYTSPSICLQAAVPSKKRTPWLSEIANNEDATSSSTGPVTARLWSPLIPARLGMRCLGLQYSIRLAKVSSTMVPVSKTVPTLSLLHRQEGCIYTLLKYLSQYLKLYVLGVYKSSVQPFHVWTFDEDMGDWMNDMNNWRQRWRLQNLSMPNGRPFSSVCLQAALQTPALAKKRTPWLSEVESSEEEAAATSHIQARLWSPKIPARLGMRCITLQYSFRIGAASADGAVDSASSTSLSLMQRQEGCRIASKFILFVFNLKTSQLNCTFDSPCGWHSDANDWDEARWLTVELQGAAKTTNNMATCFAKPKWLKKEKLAARLWSPSIGRPSLLSPETVAETIPFEWPIIQCLRFSYLFAEDGEKEANAAYAWDSTAHLVSFGRNLGYMKTIFLPVCSQRTTKEGADLNCTFETGSCEWTNDPNNWLASWQTSSGRRAPSKQNAHSSPELCLKPTSRSPSSADSSSPLDFTGRLYSPLLGSSDRVASGGVLPHRLGCSFDSGNACSWASDPRDTRATWRVREDVTWPGNGVLCVDRTSAVRIRQKSTLSARIWSATVMVEGKGSSENFDSSESPEETLDSEMDMEPALPVQCIRLVYLIDAGQVPQHSDARLAEQRPRSRRPPPVDCNFEETAFPGRLCGWNIDPRDVGAAWHLDSSSQDTWSTVACVEPTLYSSEIEEEEAEDSFKSFGSATQTSSPRTFSVHQPLRPLTGANSVGSTGAVGVVDCNFESGNFCRWKDDPRDSGAAWSIVDLSSESGQSGHVLCLRPASTAASEDFDDPFEDIPRARKAEVSTRLWSPRVRMGVAPLMCLKVAYSIRPSMNNSARLSLMRHSSGYSAVHTYLDLHNRVVSSADCDFDVDGLCRWMPDPRDGGGRWSLEAPMGTQAGNGVVCLRPGRHSDLQADPFSLLDDEADESVIGSSSNSGSRNLSARLWSSKIRTLDGTPVQCLKMAYQIVLGEPSVVEESLVFAGPPNLAILRHSSGLLVPQFRFVGMFGRLAVFGKSDRRSGLVEAAKMISGFKKSASVRLLTTFVSYRFT
ncbi:unnamed protein product [Schistocephalus solidus]|uniref:MAM domain-containing protein n=1 Tax=Schistocephalus solidus TaxID=70667 RepID=A0A183T9C4_SCHSO|nr:unnamed protein product [Schistocephalus solidus]